MTFKIDKLVRQQLSIFSLSGRIESDDISTLTRLLDLETEKHRIVLNLEEVKLVDRDAVLFFVRCDKNGLTLESVPPYIREWMEREKD